MVRSDASIALRLTLQDIAEYFESPRSSRTPQDAAHLLNACIPLLNEVGCPYEPPPARVPNFVITHFVLRLNATPQLRPSVLPATFVLALTDISDYLLHLSRGGAPSYGIDNYITAQCVGLLEQLGTSNAPCDPLP
jgi:hypothetical protein